MIARTLSARSCVHLVFLFVAFLLCSAAVTTSASAQGQGSYAIFLYDKPPNPNYEVTSTYVDGHVTDRYQRVIYVTLNYVDGHVIDVSTSNVIGYCSPVTAFQPTPAETRAFPFPLFALWTVERLWRLPR